MPRTRPLDNLLKTMARNRAEKVRNAFANNPENRYRVMKQMEDDLIGELTPMITKQWKPAMRMDAVGLSGVVNSGRFKNQFETGSSGGYYGPSDRRDLSDRYFYGRSPFGDHDFEREKYGYLRRPKKVDGEDDVGFYGPYDISFKPQVRKTMTVTNGDSFNNSQGISYGQILGTPIVPEDPETYINWVAPPSIEDYPEIATEKMFSDVLSDLKFYHRPTFRPGNESYIEAQYHGPLTAKDINSVRMRGNNIPGWLVEGSDKYGFPVYDQYSGKCIYNCR